MTARQKVSVQAPHFPRQETFPANFAFPLFIELLQAPLVPPLPV